MLIKILRYILAFEIIFFVFFCYIIYIQLNSNCTDNISKYSEHEIIQYNQGFECYVGRNKTAYETRTMISAVIAHNASEKNNGLERIISVNNIKPTRTPIIKNNIPYNIIATYDEDGLIINLNTDPIITELGQINGGE